MADATRIQIPAELEQRMDAAIARYPSERRRSASMPLLHLWQEHFGFINDEAIFWIAEKLGLQPINILEVVTFYPMFRQHPAGKTHIRICRTLSCAMAGGLEVMENLCASLGIQRPSDGEETHNPIAVSADGTYSVEFVECLASCHTAPVCMIGEQLHEKINPESAARPGQGAAISSPPHDRRRTRDRRSLAMAAASFGTPVGLQEYRAPRLDERHRLLPPRRRLRTIKASVDSVAR